MSDHAEPRIAFIGCVGEGRRSLETLLDLKADVVGVFTLKPEAAAKVSGAVPWEDVASDHGIPLHYVRNVNDVDAVATMKALAPDLVFCVGWTQLLHREILLLPRLGCVGFHASPLPRYRGRAPVNWAIIHGEKETGNTMMLLDEGVDTGDVLAQRRFPIDDDDTCAVGTRAKVTLYASYYDVHLDKGVLRFQSGCTIHDHTWREPDLRVLVTRKGAQVDGP